MKYSVLVAFIAAFVPFYPLCAEPSAFGAGDLSNPKPYGLTSNEKVLLETNQKLHSVEVKSNRQDNKVDSIRERIDGFQSIIESLSRKFQDNKIAIQKLEDASLQKAQESNEYEQRLSALSQSNAQNIDKLKVAMAELSKLIDTINSSYVSKDDFNTLVSDVNKFKSVVAKELKITSSSSSSKLDSMSNALVFKKANQYYSKKNYDKAIEYFSHSIEHQYKPATSHYMIGEIYYYKKNYADAISYFKKSASLYSRASYMPTLMLHTAIAMQKTKDIKNAKAFYNALISKYPNTKMAKKAKQQLSSIK